VDKVRESGWSWCLAMWLKVPTWKGCDSVYETRVMNRLDVDESTLFVFEVLKVKVRPGIADEWGFDFGKVNIPLHGAGRVFHRVETRKLFARR
jgi:hypothetical protein